MFSAKWFGFKKERRMRTRGADSMNEQVKKMLGEKDQKLILMVRS